MTSVSLAAVPRRRLRILRRASESIRPSSPRPQRRDCHGRLLALLAELAGPDGEIRQASFRPWCSATFVGAQHRLGLHLGGTDAAARADALAAALADQEFRLPGHIVADLVVEAVRHEGEAGSSLDLAVLTIEDW
jgi:hypothetical protein